MVQEISQTFSKTLTEVVKTQGQVVDKALALLSTKDPLAFQTIQAMNNPDLENYTPYVDNSDQGYYEQFVADQEEEDPLSEQERRLYSGIPNI